MIVAGLAKRGTRTPLALPFLQVGGGGGGAGGGGGGGAIMKETKQPCTLAFGAFRVILREHHIHEASWATDKNH